VATLDAGSTDFAHTHAVRVRANERVTVPMASQSVSVLQVSCKR
jgi:hypothetical protein